MAFNPNLDIEITDLQQEAIKADLLDSKNALTAIASVTISKAEGEHLNGIDNKRLPYVQRAVNEFAGAYPLLVSKRVSAARAEKLFDALVFLRELDGQLAEFQDRRGDLSTNIEELLYRFMRDMYDDAKKYEGDIEGADVVKAYLGELFEGQGAQNKPPVPNP